MGSKTAVKDLEEALRYRVFTAGTKGASSKVDKTVSESGRRNFRQGGVDRKFYCADFNRGNCVFTDTHDGKFNHMMVKKIHMCKVCWEKDQVERGHPENHSECPHKQA